ncbi:hypothetical protein V6N13_121101 [Hibiscus sabdariffa]|uniref:Uncharacterized protein n=1 Tax=Hibiscus sabdariffa TaxID=183260 RepID=A0ABR2E832_9ROSI
MMALVLQFLNLLPIIKEEIRNLFWQLILFMLVSLTLVPIVGPILSQIPGLYLNSENFATAMNCDGEDSPIEHVDGLKRPCIYSDAIGVSLTKDSAGAHDGSTSEPNPYISAGLVNPASQPQ